MGSPQADLSFQIFSFWAVMVYMALWVIGDWYVLKVDAINWDEDASLDSAKMGTLVDRDEVIEVFEPTIKSNPVSVGGGN